jgi:hypothetical protein
MSLGPNGQKRPTAAISLAVILGKIATGEIEDTGTDPVTNKSPADAVAVAIVTGHWGSA